MKRRLGILYLKTLYNFLLIGILVGLLFVAYFFTYQTFSNEPYNEENIKSVEVKISKKDSTSLVAAKLRNEGLIVGTYQFRLRKYCSKYKNQKFVPGTYRISSSLGMEDMIAILTGEREDIDERNRL